MAGLYQAMGGAAGCRNLATKFYALVELDPLLRPLFPGSTFRCAIEEFSAFLVQFLGGPSEDTQRRWWLSLRESHLRFQIGQKERDAWMRNMIQALDDARLEKPVRQALLGLFERSSAYVVNCGQGRTEAHVDPVPREIAERWDVQLALDQAVAAVRKRDADSARALAESVISRIDRAVFASLLALMIANGGEAMLQYVRKKLEADPALSRTRYSGRTLLHAAAAAGSLETVEDLLRVGADPNTLTAGGHPPLYCVGNECKIESGTNVVRALIRAGAKVDASDGVKRCTALHMAARRGAVGVAEALLDCGADIEAHDSLGETPLRRAVNCNKVEVAALLLARGADAHSRGSKGLTPISAARSAAMKRLLFARG